MKQNRKHLFDPRQAGVTLTEVVISLAVMAAFSASAISAFIINQKSSLVGAYNSEANRILHRYVQMVQSTNYSSLNTQVYTNYNESSIGGEGAMSAGAIRTFRTRPGVEWRTNLQGALAYETILNVSESNTFKKVEITVYWECMGRFMTNRTSLMRARNNQVD